MAVGDWVALLAAIAALLGGLAAIGPRRRVLIVFCILFVLAAIVVAILSTLNDSDAKVGESPSPSVSVSESPTPTIAAEPNPVIETNVRQLNVVAYSGELRSGYTVEGTFPGTCVGSSMALIDNPNAYRCFFENSEGSFVADPCLAMSDGASVYCLHDPWALSGTILNLDEPVDFDPAFDASSGDRNLTFPWALELVDPRNPNEAWQCLPVLGAQSEIAGNHSTWNCVRRDGSGSGNALNSVIIEDDDPVWTVLFSDDAEPELVEADVKIAWYG